MKQNTDDMSFFEKSRDKVRKSLPDKQCREVKSIEEIREILKNKGVKNVTNYIIIDRYED